MKVIHTRYLNDGQGFNQGQEADLIQVESPADFDQMLHSIAATGFYDGDYLDQNLGYGHAELKAESLPLAAILDVLGPMTLLELGCGKGDVLMLLERRGRADVRGLDVSPQIVSRAWESLSGKLDVGDLLELAPRYRDQGMRFHTFCGLDIWEHLHPGKLDDYIQTMLSLAEDDALFFFIIPGFGQDKVWGQLFFLEFEENRQAFDARQPFPYLLAARTDPPIPANGHLTWAHTQWWESLFARHGLVRCLPWERNLHAHLDGFLHWSQRCFYLLRRETRASSRRVAGCTRYPLNHFVAWHLMYLYDREVRRLEKELGRKVADQERLEVFRDLNHERLLWHFDQDIRALAKPLPWRLDWLVRRFMPLPWKDRLQRLLGKD
jgi:SAM-dependent methyltransferase